ncbi:MAG: RagB/SusD family nutrient uptake outer membrane protein [Cruoricaptor ignavus]|nr:RagB/SusD family nutrient uptake outer membrane protein [Cruoricaptor ignavus]
MKIIKYSIFSLALMGTIACSSDLLNTVPEAEKVVTNFYKSGAEIEQAVNGAYAALELPGQYRIAIPAMGEIPSDNSWTQVAANDDGVYGQIDELNIVPTNVVLNNHWRDHYIGIQRCNIIINRIEGVNDMTEAMKKSRKGEAQFLRALMYFNLVNAFGDVPLVIDETTDVNAYFGQGRTPKAEVLLQVEKDLAEAITLLPEIQNQKGRATKNAARAILGRVLLSQNKFAEALSQLKLVESSGQYGLLDDPAQIFEIANKNNQEIIFDVQHKNIIDGNSQSSNAYQFFMPAGMSPSVGGAKGHNIPTADVFNSYDSSDLRRDAYIGTTSGGIHFTKKLKRPTIAVQYGESNVPVIRYADVLLMIAECEAQLGNNTGALSAMNTLKVKRGLVAFSSSSQTEILNEIANERRKEFVSEGLRWFDLIRTGKAIEVMTEYFRTTPGYAGSTITENKLLYPVPQSQIDTDPSIKQNP